MSSFWQTENLFSPFPLHTHYHTFILSVNTLPDLKVQRKEMYWARYMRIGSVQAPYKGFSRWAAMERD